MSDIKKELIPLEKEVACLPTQQNITSNLDYEVTRTSYKTVRELEKKVIEKKQLILRPMAEAVAQVKSLFAPIEKKLAAIIEVYEFELNRYANQKEIERLMSLRAIESDKRIKNIETIQSKKEEVGERLEGTMRLKKLVIDDYKKIPNEYWAVDERKLKEALIGGKKVPGAHIEEVLTITSR